MRIFLFDQKTEEETTLKTGDAAVFYTLAEKRAEMSFLRQYNQDKQGNKDETWERLFFAIIDEGNKISMFRKRGLGYGNVFFSRIAQVIASTHGLEAEESQDLALKFNGWEAYVFKDIGS